MIEVRELVYRYGDGESSRSPALDGVTLAIGDGEFVLLVGPNGSGKTTLVRQFNGLLTPDEGTVLVDGQPVESDLVAARTSVAMVFQDPRDGVVAATVGADVAFGPENLGLDRAEIDRRVGEALAAVGMAGREDERIDALSGGERQRVAVAGALAMEPSHLVLDEPFTGLDGRARRRLLSRLRDLHESGTGVVVVTHDLRDLLEPADRVIGMEDGEIAVDASPHEAVERVAELGVQVPRGRDSGC